MVIDPKEANSNKALMIACSKLANSADTTYCWCKTDRGWETMLLGSRAKDKNGAGVVLVTRLGYGKAEWMTAKNMAYSGWEFGRRIDHEDGTDEALQDQLDDAFKENAEFEFAMAEELEVKDKKIAAYEELMGRHGVPYDEFREVQRQLEEDCM